MEEEIKKIYEQKSSNFIKTKDEVYYIIESFLEKTDIKIHSIQSRIKTIESLINKVNGTEINDPSKVFDEIKDIIGLRIICLFVSDITEIIILLKENFHVIQEDNKLTNNDISSFGYFSVHFTCKLKKEFKGPRYDNIKELAFEIQVRTISMDAWANISHYLDYKSEMEVPKELKKDFFALSGLFYVADTHFEMFYKNKKRQSTIAKKDVEKNIDVEINFETIEAYINNKFKNRQVATNEAISKLTQELINVGYKQLSDLDNKLIIAFKLTPENKYLPGLNRVGIIRTALRKVDPAYNKYWEEIKNKATKK